MVASRMDPYLGFLVNTSDPLSAMIVMELRNGLNCPNESVTADREWVEKKPKYQSSAHGLCSKARRQLILLGTLVVQWSKTRN